MSTLDVELLCMGCFKELESVSSICPFCGYDPNQEVPLHQLKPRTILNGKYLIGKVLGEGGFGITYIGWDINLQIKIAVKEYYPTGYVTREATTVQPFTGSRGEFFIKGCERFVEEARRLAKFRSMPGIVAVSDFFKENRTAYIVMEFVEGKTLKTFLEEGNEKLPVTQLFNLIKPVITSLAEVHKAGMIHRDISPDNIMISEGGQLKLLDFGAAREFTESGNKSLSIMLKPGYAPEEQYRSRGIQGPWTDIYSLCATIYKCITGVTPEESTDRVHSDEVKPPSALGIAIDAVQEAALMKGMAVLQNDRFQSLSELYAALYEQQADNTQTVIIQETKQVTQVQDTPEPLTQNITQLITPEPEQKPEPKIKKIGLIAAAVLVFAAGLIFLTSRLTDTGVYKITSDNVRDVVGSSFNYVVNFTHIQTSGRSLQLNNVAPGSEVNTASGKLTLILTDVSPFHLRDARIVFEDFNNRLSIDSQGLKLYRIDSFYDRDQSSTDTLSNPRQIRPPVEFIYADRNAVINGTVGRFTYNLDLKKGWNTINRSSSFYNSVKYDKKNSWVVY